MGRLKRWSPDEKSRAVKMRRQRMSAAQIGAVLGRSRSAVCKKLWEMEEPGVLASPYARAAVNTLGQPLARRYSWEDDV